MPAGLLLICNGSQLSIQNLNAAPTFPEKADNGADNVNSQYTNLILAL